MENKLWAKLFKKAVSILDNSNIERNEWSFDIDIFLRKSRLF
jgi:hypothetical protein